MAEYIGQYLIDFRVCSSGVDVSFFPPFVTHLRQTKQDDWKRWSTSKGKSAVEKRSCRTEETFGKEWKLVTDLKKVIELRLIVREQGQIGWFCICTIRWVPGILEICIRRDKENETQFRCLLPAFEIDWFIWNIQLSVQRQNHWIAIDGWMGVFRANGKSLPTAFYTKESQGNINQWYRQ